MGLPHQGSRLTRTFERDFAYWLWQRAWQRALQPHSSAFALRTVVDIHVKGVCVRA